ncbi:unnamed protein product [Symbiodinium sp. CCMP2592]|nr:unnamed protein product [Symbiodinium sp. CCMP2592]
MHPPPGLAIQDLTQFSTEFHAEAPVLPSFSPANLLTSLPPPAAHPVPRPAKVSGEQQVSSKGTIGHPFTCAGPCRYVKRKGGCREGARCADVGKYVRRKGGCRDGADCPKCPGGTPPAWLGAPRFHDGLSNSSGRGFEAELQDDAAFVALCRHPSSLDTAEIVHIRIVLGCSLSFTQKTGPFSEAIGFHSTEAHYEPWTPDTTVIRQEAFPSKCWRNRARVIVPLSTRAFVLGKSWHCVIEIKSAAGYEPLGGAGDV